MRSILWEMDDVSCSTSTEFHGVEVTTTNNNGEEETATKTVTETVLTITITHKTAVEMAGDYHFNSHQNEYLALMMQPDNQVLWSQLLHSLVTGGGQIILLCDSRSAGAARRWDRLYWKHRKLYR